MEHTDIEEVDEVHFQYNNRTISFLTDGGVGEEPMPQYSKGELVSILSFNLQYLADNYTVIELGTDKKPETAKEESGCEDANDTGFETSRKGYRQYIRFISTPMGGMTRWKRR